MNSGGSIFYSLIALSQTIELLFSISPSLLSHPYFCILQHHPQIRLETAECSLTGTVVSERALLKSDHVVRFIFYLFCLNLIGLFSFRQVLMHHTLACSSPCSQGGLWHFSLLKGLGHKLWLMCIFKKLEFIWNFKWKKMTQKTCNATSLNKDCEFKTSSVRPFFYIWTCLIWLLRYGLLNLRKYFTHMQACMHMHMILTYVLETCVF